MTNPTTETDGVDLDGLAARITAYFDRREKMLGVDPDVLHTIDAGQESEQALYIRDILALLQEALAQRDRADRLAGALREVEAYMVTFLDDQCPDFPHLERVRQALKGGDDE